MVVMTPCSTIHTEERRALEDGSAATHSHRRRWSTPADPGGESLHECLTTDHEYKEQPSSHVLSEVSFEEICSCSSLSGNGYSFYLGGEMTPWGAPLLTAPIPSAPRMVTRGEGRRGRSVRRKKELPPFLTTLDCNGRPRFYHRRVRSEGRLEIARVAVNLPEIVSVRGIEGLRIGTVRVVGQQHEHEHGEGDGNDVP